MVDPTVCHIPPVAPKTQPSPINLPSIPPAEATIPSLQNTVNAMRMVLQILVGQQGLQGQQGKPGKNANAEGQFVETKRVVETVRVFNPNDNTQFVDVERTNQLVMTNKATKQTWAYNRGRS